MTTMTRMMSASWHPEVLTRVAAVAGVEPAAAVQKDNAVHEQLRRLSAQLRTVLTFTTSLEAQHTVVQGTIVALEGKGVSLEELLQDAEQALRSSTSASAAASVPSITPTIDQQRPMKLTALLAMWKSSVEVLCKNSGLLNGNA